MISFSFFIIFYLHIFPSKTFAACYKPNGIDVNEQLNLDDYQPCDGGDDESMCCALNRLYPDKCRSDGLCSGYRYPDIAIWRDSCTDPTWKSPKCLKLCTQGSCKSLSFTFLSTFEHKITCDGMQREIHKYIRHSGHAHHGCYSHFL